MKSHLYVYYIYKHIHIYDAFQPRPIFGSIKVSKASELNLTHHRWLISYYNQMLIYDPNSYFGLIKLNYETHTPHRESVIWAFFYHKWHIVNANLSLWRRIHTTQHHQSRSSGWSLLKTITFFIYMQIEKGFHNLIQILLFTMPCHIYNTLFRAVYNFPN